MVDDAIAVTNGDLISVVSTGFAVVDDTYDEPVVSADLEDLPRHWVSCVTLELFCHRDGR